MTEIKKRQMTRIKRGPQYGLKSKSNYKRPKFAGGYRKNLELWLKKGYYRGGIEQVYSEQEMKVRKIIYLLGGRKAVVEVLRDKAKRKSRVKVNTVSKWIKRGMIPKEYWVLLATALKGKMTLEQLASLFLPVMIKKSFRRLK